MISQKYKCAVNQGSHITFLTEEPKKISGGYMTKYGKRFVGKNVTLHSRWTWYVGNKMPTMCHVRNLIKRKS